MTNKKNNTISSYWLGLILFLFFGQSVYAQEYGRPNIIYILADDLGYGELGCYGQQKIETPNIDELARNGMRFTNHYAASPVCAPSRCGLLTGLHPGHAFIRGNHEWESRGDVWNYKAIIADSTLEGQYPLPDTTRTIAELLRHAGYATGMIGKWGLGAPQTNSVPNKMGFDYYYGYNCQRVAHTYYPVFMWEDTHRVSLLNDTVKPHEHFIEGLDSLQKSSYKRYSGKEYSPDLMQKKAIGFIRKNRVKPFFLYYATTLPHLPLQAPDSAVEYYVKKFGDEPPLVKAAYYPCRYPHATYAAMISYIDKQVGEIVAELKRLGIYQNTLIIFTSDNGPTYIDADTKWFDSAKPFSTGYDSVKGHVYEGGIRVPMIAVWPDIIKPGSVSDHISAFWDVMPTLCDIANISTPSFTDGISFLPELDGKKQKEHDYLYWEFPEYGGQQAVRMGRWKAVRKDIQKGNLGIALYDLKLDPMERNDLSKEHPKLVKKMESIMKKEHVEPEVDRFKLKALGDSLNTK